ncbi:hypothetical protein GCM10020258_06670 [Sphingomonas yabuuchiae]
MTDITLPDLDRAIGFIIPEHHARGRLVRLGPVLDEILAAHAYPPAIERLLAEALTLTALMGATLKDTSGQLTIQTRSDSGVIRLLVCDYRGGELRGYVQYDEDRLAELPAEPTLFALFGQGYLAITFDLAMTDERYQGIVPLDGDTLSSAAESYFIQSEQIPSLLRVGISKGRTGGRSRAACSFSTCPRARKGASGCTSSSTIRNGSMSRRWARRCRSRNWPTPRCRWRLWYGGCSTRSRMSACRKAPPSCAAAAARRSISPASSRSSRSRNGARWRMPMA